MRRIQIHRRTHHRRARENEPLPLDPRDTAVVRAKQIAHGRGRDRKEER